MSYTHPLIPSSWIGHRIGLEAPQFKHLGEAKIDHSRWREDAGFELSDKGPLSPVIKRPIEQLYTSCGQPLRVLDFKTRQQYRMMPEHRSGALLRREFQRAGGADDPTSVAELQNLVLIGGGGVLPAVTGDEDTRIQIEPTTVFPYSALVHLTGSVASGALIGDNIVLTAAHCVVNGGVHQNPGYEEIWYDNTVIPGMDRNPECASGDADDACKLAPFGQSAVAMAIVPEGWLTPKGGPAPGEDPSFFSHDPNDWVDDIAVLILTQSFGQQTGTFDYRAFSASQLENAAFLNRGYPSPFKNPKPDGYQPWQMWGDENYCFVEGFLGEVNGIHRLFRHEADTSGGHSGSPIYQWHVSLDQGWRPQIAGVISHHASGMNYARRVVEQDLLVDLGMSMGLAFTT